MEAVSTRTKWVDVGKAIGLTCIILAHTEPNAPDWIMQTRSFDVVLMVLLSGYLSAGSYRGQALKYYRKRFFRLILPTWIFVVGYNCFLIAAGVEISLERWVKCLLLTRDGMGYIWVILVYFLCALLTPLLHQIYQQDKNGKFIVIYFIIVLIYEAMCHNGIVSKYILLDYSIGYIIPYGFAYYLGGVLRHFWNERKCLGLLSFFAVVYLAISVSLYIKYGHWIMTAEYKYPARLYYLSFGISVSLLIILILNKAEIKLKEIYLIRFISGHSLWMYLWHIFVIKIQRTVLPNINWLIQFFILIIASMVITYIWSLMIEHIRNILPARYQDLVKIFEG